MYVSPARNSINYIKATIDYQRDYVPRIIAVTETGFHEINETRLFCLPGGCIDATGKVVNNVICELKTAADLNGVLGFNDEALSPDALKILYKTIPGAKLIPSLPYFLSGIISYVCEIVTPRFTLYYEGETKSGKTTLAAVFSCLFGNFTRDNFRGATLDTGNSIEAYMHSLKDICAVVDDIHPDDSKYGKDETVQKLERLIRSVGNKQARGRLNDKAESGNIYDIQSNMLITAEYNPLKIKSSINRIVIIDFIKDMSGKEYAIIDKLKPQINAFGRDFTLWVMNMPREKFSAHISKLYHENYDDIKKEFGEENITEHIAVLLTVWDIIIEFLLEREIITADESLKLKDDIGYVLDKLWLYNCKRAEDVDPVNMIVKTIKRNCDSSTGYRIAESWNDMQAAKPSDKIYGFKNQDDNGNPEIWLNITDITNMISREIPAINPTQDMIAESLGKAGYLKPARTGTYTRRKGESNYLVFAEKFFHTDMT